MCTSRLPSRSLRALIIAAVAAACSVAVAAPYAVNYQGNISSSDFPEITVGESYTLTLVFDNGGDLAPVFPDPPYSQRNAASLTVERRAWAA